VTTNTVILVDPERFLELHDHVTATVASAKPALASPIYFADGDDPGLATVAAIAGVHGVDVVDDDTAGIILGIDRVIAGMSGYLGGWDVGGVAAGEPYPTAEGTWTGQSAPPACCVAANFSLSPASDDVAPTRPNDAVNFATRFLSQFAVPVVASGNHHRAGSNFETVAPWAEPEWVLGVGATSDELGTTEWEHSGRGSARNRTVGPDVLAWGQNPYVDNEFGTSFSAARASGMVAVTAAVLATLRANLDREAGRPFGVPLIGIAVIDRGFARPELIRPRTSLPALPVLPVANGAFAGTDSGTLDEFAGALGPPTWPTLARRVVTAASIATSPTPNLSAPAITKPGLVRWLSTIGLGGLHQVLTTGATSIDPASEQALFTAPTIERLWQLVEATMPLWQWDIRTRSAQPPIREVQP